MTVVTNPGNCPLNKRWTLILTPTGDDVIFTNEAEAEPPLHLAPVGGYDELVIDGYNCTVFADGVALPALTKAGSGWPALVPGVQTVTVTGATGILRFTIRNL